MNISSNSPSMRPILPQAPSAPSSQPLPSQSPPSAATLLPSAPEQATPPTVRPSFDFDAPAVAFPNASPPVSKEEKAWAIALENKVKTQNHQPTNEEVEKYEDIFQRLQADGMQKKKPEPSSTPASQKEIDWALKMESKVKEGYNPSPEEMAKYKKIAKRLQTEGQQKKTSPAPPTTVPKEELDWAMELESKVKEGHEPSSEEIAKYDDIAERLKIGIESP